MIDPSISTSSKKSFLLNLIYKSLKRDSAVARKVAIARRLLQVSNLDEPFLACASLYTISEANKNSNIEPTDAHQKNSEESNNQTESPSCQSDKNSAASHNSLKTDSYSAGIRNPLYSNADRQDLWEFSLLSRNFHPSVNEFVSSLLINGEVSYSGDPFNDFTRIKFLDKFVFKNPKKGVKAANRKFYTRNQADSHQPQVYSSEFKDQKESKVNADERFFFEYFKAQKTVKVADQEEKDDHETETDTLDFAEDIKFSSTAKQEKKKKTKEVGSDEEDDDDASDSGSEYSYGDIDDEEDGTEQLNDKAYEKFLWENLNSDGESIEESGDDEDDVGTSNIMEEADDDEWEDIGVAGSDDEIEDEPNAAELDSEFTDANNLDSIILKHHNKMKRKKGSFSDEETKSVKKTKIKKSGKSKKNKFKKLKSS